MKLVSCMWIYEQLSRCKLYVLLWGSWFLKKKREKKRKKRMLTKPSVWNSRWWIVSAISVTGSPEVPFGEVRRGLRWLLLWATLPLWHHSELQQAHWQGCLRLLEEWGETKEKLKLYPPMLVWPLLPSQQFNVSSRWQMESRDPA